MQEVRKGGRGEGKREGEREGKKERWRTRRKKEREGVVRSAQQHSTLINRHQWKTLCQASHLVVLQNIIMIVKAIVCAGKVNYLDIK